MAKLDKRWFKGLSKEDQAKEKQALLASGESFRKLKGLLEAEYEASIKAMRAADNYELANWSMFVADKMSEQRTLKRVIDLLPLDNKD